MVGTLVAEAGDATPLCNSDVMDVLGDKQVVTSHSPIDPNAMIILHPGSRNLRLGRPSDSAPFTVLHAIARKQKQLAALAARRLDPYIVHLAKMVRTSNICLLHLFM